MMNIELRNEIIDLIVEDITAKWQDEGQSDYASFDDFVEENGYNDASNSGEWFAEKLGFDISNDDWIDLIDWPMLQLMVDDAVFIANDDI